MKNTLVKILTFALSCPKRRMPHTRHAVGLAHETLEPKRLLTAISFTQHDSSIGERTDVTSFVSSDIDGDGDLDIVTTTDLDDRRASGIEWHENSGNAQFDRRETIASFELKDGSFVPIYYADSLVAADVNNDGFTDVVAQLEGDETVIVWYQNHAATGGFFDAKRIGEGTLIASDDFDGDGDADFLASIGRNLTLLENADGRGGNWTENAITADAWGLSITVVDLDGDGDKDLLTQKGAWYENDGNGRFETHFLPIGPGSIFRAIDASDLDGDGDMDIVTVDRERASSPDCQLIPLPLCEPGNLEIVWYENTEGLGALSTKQAIGVDPHMEPVVSFIDTVVTHDMDGDGDEDVLVVSTLQFGVGEFGAPVTDKITWYENIENGSAFSDARVVPANTNFISAIEAADLDNDGDADLVFMSHLDRRVTWLESNASERGTRVLGDSNGDGLFDSSDLVAVFAAGEYEDDIENNSMFEDGDWNGDGEFDSNDLVTAFQAGGYLMKATSQRLDMVGVVDRLFSGMDSSNTFPVGNGTKEAITV